MRQFLHSWLKDPALVKTTAEENSAHKLKNGLRPPEIAYLVRGGDTTHALIVLAVDLTQRGLRKNEDETFTESLCDYEKNMLEIVRGAFSSWATKKTKDVVLGSARSPRQIAARITFLYRFLTGSLKAFIEETISDPGKLRKYFSYQGLLRILADFTSAGYRQAFEEELRKSLLRRGLILDAAHRHRAARALAAGAVLGLIGTAFLAFHFEGSLASALIIWITSLVMSAGARLVLALRNLVPLYQELAVIADQVIRKSLRLRFLILLLRSFNLLATTLAVSLALLAGLVGLGLCRLLYAPTGSFEILTLIAFSLANFAVLQLAFDAFDLFTREYPSGIARKQLDSLRAELENKSPLDSFKLFLTNRDYDPTLSKLVAVYGIETLLLFV
ncbi:MAG: hypothetical protein KC777_25755 [Cyanobacteria bacterium HKST-UBA02]|nr:hypothetical protein [Cyanobacteria bacterium HKST-UBA02]